MDFTRLNLADVVGIPHLYAMQALAFPSYPFEVKRDSGQELIWDGLRKKWLVLTPEEWVRQHLVEFLVQERAFPRGRTMLEYRFKINKMDRRADLVVFDDLGTPVFMAECKRPTVALDQKTLDQVARYNITLGVPYLLITNGLQHYCLEIKRNNQAIWLNDIPKFEDLSA